MQKSSILKIGATKSANKPSRYPTVLNITEKQSLILLVLSRQGSHWPWRGATTCGCLPGINPFVRAHPKTGLAITSAPIECICCDSMLLRLHIFHGLDNFHGFCFVIFKSLPLTELAPRLRYLMQICRNSLGSFWGYFCWWLSCCYSKWCNIQPKA